MDDPEDLGLPLLPDQLIDEFHRVSAPGGGVLTQQDQVLHVEHYRQDVRSLLSERIGPGLRVVLKQAVFLQTLQPAGECGLRAGGQLLPELPQVHPAVQGTQF